MSSNDLNDWTESLDFESLAEEQEADGAVPEADYLDLQDEAEPESEPEQAAQEADVQPPRKVVQAPPREHVSGTGLGLAFAAGVLAVGTVVVCGLTAALNVGVDALWRPQGLTGLDRLLDFRTYPHNAFYLACVASLVVAFLGAGLVAKRVRRVQDQVAYETDILARVASLRIDEDHGWQDEALRGHPTMSSFVTENLGAWRLLEARQRRYSGLEAELQRLSGAAATDDREGLAGRFENPTVSSLADEIVRYFDERKSARKQAAALHAADRESSEQLMKLVGAARGWTAAAMDQVGVQGAAAEGVAKSLQQVMATSAGEGDDPVATAVAALAALRKAAAAPPTTAAQTANVGPEIEDLVDRGNKLAFQIAMEVARLGPRGERLLPMTQALEDLTTEFRQAAENIQPATHGRHDTSHLEAGFTQVQDALTAAAARFRAWNHAVREAVPSVDDVAANLYGLARGFDGQSQRLVQLGERCGSLTGLAFDSATVPTVDPVEAPETDLGFTRLEPFSDTPLPSEAASDLADLSFDEPEPRTDLLADLDFAGLTDDVPTTAPADTSPAAPEAFPAADDPFPALEPAFPDTDEPLPTEEAYAPEAAETFPDVEEMFPGDDESVYDMDAFGAVAADEPNAGTDSFPDPEPTVAPAVAPAATAATAEDDAVDLAVFGAVRLDEDTPSFGTGHGVEIVDDVHDLSEFGAVPLD